jgi:hypothetical protein
MYLNMLYFILTPIGLAPSTALDKCDKHQKESVSLAISKLG